MSGEAQRVLRGFPTKSSEKEGPKPMPSFPDMVAYIQEKVRFSCFGLRYSTTDGHFAIIKYLSYVLNLPSPGSSEAQDSS